MTVSRKNTSAVITPDLSETTVSTAYTADEELSRLAAVTEQLTRTMEKTRIAEYVDYLEHPGRLLWSNFLIGLARGLGGTVGLAIVLGAFFFVVQNLIMLNLPVISDFIADFIRMIQENYQMLQ